MTRSYDYDELGRRYDFGTRQVEKVCRISDFLEDLSSVRFLRERLCLYGGTALAFVYFDEIQRLSIDIDFNYRHLNDGDWGDIRDEVDDRIKSILYAQGYEASDLAINASYPLTRITVKYRNLDGLNDSFMIETGYMRRIPILTDDTVGTFRHIGTGEGFAIKIPRPEELYANKWCTLLYRGSSRDLFDVFQISKMRMSQDIFRKCAVVDSLMRDPPKLYKLNVREIVDSIPIDTGLRNLLQTTRSMSIDVNSVRQDVLGFSRRILKELKQRERDAIDVFYDERVFEPAMIDTENILNKNILKHPMIRRKLQN